MKFFCPSACQDKGDKSATFRLIRHLNLDKW